MIIDNSYLLTKEVFIPNAVVQPSIGSNTPNSVTQLNQEIDDKENELLLSFLGYAQTNELLSQFESNGDWTVTAEQKWKDLVDGKDEWKGLRYTIGTKKISLIAFYVFFYYLKSDFSTYSTNGVQVAQSENAISQLPNEKQVTAWNKFVRMYQGGNFTKKNYHFGNNWNGQYLSFSNTNNNNEISLYDFMTRNSGIYDISFFTRQGLINSVNL